jgi:hypothetical protein
MALLGMLERYALIVELNAPLLTRPEVCVAVSTCTFVWNAEGPTAQDCGFAKTASSKHLVLTKGTERKEC